MDWLDPSALPLWGHIVGALLAAAGVWFGGARLAEYGDGIAERTGWSRAFVGVLLLAGMTELPELVTTVAAAVSGNAPMAVNNLFGGITLQTAILVLADLSLRHGPLTFFVPSSDLILQGLLLVLLLALSLACIVIGEPFSVLGVGPFALLLLTAYVAALWLLRRYKGNHAWRPVDIPDALSEGEAERERRRGQNEGRSLSALVWGFLGAGFVVFVSGASVVFFAETIAERTGLGSSFIGGTLVAGTTSLPEFSTTLGAVRIGAYSMAIANVFGSNAIMVALIAPVDIAYRGGPLLDAVDDPARFSGLAGIAVTGFYLVGLVERRDRAFLRLGVDSWGVVVLYALTLVGLYALSR